LTVFTKVLEDRPAAHWYLPFFHKRPKCLCEIAHRGIPWTSRRWWRIGGDGWFGKSWEKRQTACKPGSVPALAGGWRPFIWDARYRTPLATDPDGDAETRFVLPRKNSAVPIWSCSRWGLPCRFRCRSRGALLPHPFTLTWSLAGHRRFALCCTGRRLAPPRRYLAPCPMKPGLSSPVSVTETSTVATVQPTSPRILPKFAV